jgi:hypothetical protein
MIVNIYEEKKGKYTMNHKALTIAAMLTAFILIVAGGLVLTTRAATNTAVAAPTQEIDPQTQQAILDREAAYQAAIDQANLRIQQLQAQIKPTTAPVTNITAEQAAQIASQALGQSQIYSVETVQWNNQMVYQVTFSSGDIARVGLDGTVLNIQPAAQQTTVTTVVTGGAAKSHSGEHESERENGD